MKVIKSLQNRGVYEKELLEKLRVKKENFPTFWNHLWQLLLMKRVHMPLAKSVLMSLGLTAAMSATDAFIQKKIYGSDCLLDLALHTTALIISNEEIQDIMKIVKSLEESGILIKRISETIKIEAKEGKRGFLPMLVGTLAATILGNAWTGKGVIRVVKIFNAALSFN